MKKICICSASEGLLLSDRDFFNGISWSRTTSPTIEWETPILREEEKKGKVLCKCGKYMRTHLHERTSHHEDGNAYGKSYYRMMATCSCDNPRPDIMICKNIDEVIQEHIDNIDYNIRKIKELINK